MDNGGLGKDFNLFNFANEIWGYTCKSKQTCNAKELNEHNKDIQTISCGLNMCNSDH